MLVQDARYALRMWRAYPFSMAAAILSLAVGMGANTALFSILNAALLTTAPVAQPDSLSLIYRFWTVRCGSLARVRPF
jgi:putative ABC transport system permease protein